MNTLFPGIAVENVRTSGATIHTLKKGHGPSTSRPLSFVVIGMLSP